MFREYRNGKMFMPPLVFFSNLLVPPPLYFEVSGAKDGEEPKNDEVPRPWKKREPSRSSSFRLRVSQSHAPPQLQKNYGSGKGSAFDNIRMKLKKESFLGRWKPFWGEIGEPGSRFIPWR